MILSWCIITMGDTELPKLKKAVASVIKEVDEIIIVANGTRTKETEAFCKNHAKLNYFYLSWTNDFSEQRNFAAAQVRKDADYYGWMDSDDVIINANLLRDIARMSKAREYDTVFFDYIYGAKFDGEPDASTFVEEELTQKRERLIKPGKIVWRKRIHESPVPTDNENFKYSRVPYDAKWPIVWLHLGADRDMSPIEMEAKMARNRRMLELELKDERETTGEADPRTLLYLMKIYAEDDLPEVLQLCIELGNEYLQKSGWDMERAICYQLMSKCLGKLGLNEKARDFTHNAIKEYPYDPLLYLYLARIYFNLGNFRAMKHWMMIGLNIQVEDSNNGFANILEMKILSTELMLEYYLKGEKNIRKGYESAKLLNQLNPSTNNQFNEEYLYDQKELDIASEHAHKLMDYLITIQKEEFIPSVIEAMPSEMKRLPFAIKYLNRYSPVRVWGEKEICYFVNFGGGHFEKWDGESAAKGIGGSELAVIKLSESWAKKGWKVTVYGDPIKEKEVNGVLYLPYYKFNSRDKFNIFIQWRQPTLAHKVSAKKFYCDYHDLFVEASLKDKATGVDKFFVKSKYHRDVAKSMPDNKFVIVSNGI